MQIVENRKTVKSSFIQAGGATGDLRLHRLRSRVFHNVRFLRVWLPPGYDAPENSGQHYPVFYLNDGQNLFETSTAFGGVEWQVDETADRLIREGTVPPMIIVGIDNTGRARIREYMPYRSLNPIMMRVRGMRYPDFLMQEVMPYIARRYRTASGAENAGLGGSSLGALISLYTVMSRPGIFGRLLLESPSLWASNRQLLRESVNVQWWPERVFVGAGTAETGRADRDQRMVNDVHELSAVLRRAGLGDNRFRELIKDGANHSERSWAERFPEALSFLFGRG